MSHRLPPPLLSPLLAEHLLGLLDPEEEAQLRDGLQDSEALRAELRILEDELGSLPLNLLPATERFKPPSAGLWDRLSATLDEQGRFEAFAERVATLLDTSQDRARYLMRLVESPTDWLPAFGACRVMHIRPGPAVAHCDVGLVRLPGGDSFPHHAHHGGEWVLVLQGGFEDEDGSIVSAGQLVEKGPETAHSFRALPGQDLIYLAVVDGIDFGPVPFAEPPEDLLK